MWPSDAFPSCDFLQSVNRKACPDITRCTSWPMELCVAPLPIMALQLASMNIDPNCQVQIINVRDTHIKTKGLYLCCPCHDFYCPIVNIIKNVEWFLYVVVQIIIKFPSIGLGYHNLCWFPSRTFRCLVWTAAFETTLWEIWATISKFIGCFQLPS